MKKTREISIHLIESAYRDIFRSLFSAAYMITGNERTAESVVMKIMLKYPAPDDKDYNELIECVKEDSLKAASAEDSSFFSFSGDLTNVSSPLTEWILTLDERKARVLVLKYALNLSIKEIASVTGESAERIKAVLDKGKVRSYQETKNAKTASSVLRKACMNALNFSCYPPDLSAVIRSIERIMEEKNAAASRSFSVKPVLSWLITGVLMIFIAVIIWMSVVLLDYFREPYRVNAPHPTEIVSFTEE